MRTALDSRYSLEFAVRDYECDLQGIVNNATYLHYLEHARHEFLRANGVDFAELSRAGTNLVVTRIEIDYLRSLRSGDRFAVTVDLERVSPLRVAFLQSVYRLPGLVPSVRARVVGTGVDARGRPVLLPVMDHLLGDV